VDVVFLGDFLDGFDALDRLKRHAGLEFGVVSSAFAFHFFCVFWFGLQSALTHHNHSLASGPIFGVLLKNMLEKYKKMGLAAAACTLLGVSTLDAAVTLTFTQSGPNVTATWSGTYAGVPASDSSGTVASGSIIAPTVVYGLASGTAFSANGAGLASATGLASVAGSYVGATFGFDGSRLIFGPGVVGDYSPVGTMTFTNTTLAALGAGAFSNTLAFTGNGDVGGNKTISFTTIPEPSGVALAALGCLGLAFRRRAR
jgi:hypothetical protein